LAGSASGRSEVIAPRGNGPAAAAAGGRNNAQAPLAAYDSGRDGDFADASEAQPISTHYGAAQ